MAYVAVKFLLENLSQLLKSNVNNLISSADQTELYELKNDVGLLLEAFLGETANKKAPPKEEMERQIKEVVHVIEDTIDSCLTQLSATAKGKNRLLRYLNPKRANLAKEVRSLRERLKPSVDKVITKDFADMQIGDKSGTSVDEPHMKIEKAVVHQDLHVSSQDKFVGLEDETEMIVKYVMEPKDELDVISIVGMPGLGKTTLAWKIYQNHNIQYEFPTRIWVNISLVFNRRDVLLRILKEFTSQDMSSLSDHDLAKKVHECLKTGKILLVMDDVWGVEDWNVLRDVLPKSNRMGKVIITSRYTNVAVYANPIRQPHCLRFLTQNESWELLKLEIFGRHDYCPQELEGIGEYIAMQCDGLPLAIVVIGGVLLDHFSNARNMNAIKTAWNMVSENINTILQSKDENRMSDIITLSYNRLPDDLRACFLYLGVFPEDCEIPAWTLTRLWIAEGFIQHKQELQSLELAAEENLQNLINRNLVMVDKTNSLGEIKTCRVHTVIHAFCSSKATAWEKNLFQVIKTHGIFEIQRCRRVCIWSNPSEFLSGEPKGPCVRSFLCFHKEPIILDPKFTLAIPDGFKLLRVLESKSIKFHQFPKGVTKLIHLRYITLSGDNLRVLPEAISELWNLQTIVVNTKSRQITVKANIWRMIQLRHLKTTAAIVLDIQGEGEGGENRQTLSRLSPEYCKDCVFNRARNIKTLGIFGKLASLVDANSLQKLHRVENLKLLNDLIYESASEYQLNSLPQPNCFPPNLKRLTLSATFLDWNHMSALAKIRNLEVLKLKNNAFTGKFWNVVGDSFHSLQFLLIAETDLAIWKASTDYFPRLRCLVLKNCGKLKEIPVVLAKTLQELDIERLGKSAVESARKIEEEIRRMEGRGKHERLRGGFKLSVGPGCE